MQGYTVLSVTLVPLDETTTSDLVLFDPVEFSFMLRVRRTGPRARARLAAGLNANGLLRVSNHTAAAPLRLKWTVPTRDDGKATAKAVLHLCELDDGLVISSGSTVKMNLQHVVRERHGIPASLIGLDGTRNFCGPTAERDASDLEVQLETAGRSIDVLRAAILGCLPGCEVAEEKLLLRKAEVCHDLPHPQAEDVVRATCRVPVPGSRSASNTDYRFTVEAGRSPTWHFTARKRGPVCKGYAKLHTLLRTEHSCGHRDAIVICMGARGSAPFTGAGAVELALAFYHAAGEQCCHTLDHVRRVAMGRRTTHELLTRLAGLQAIADRRPMGDGYRPSVRAAADAQRVLNALLSDGIIHALGLRKGTKVRDELERLVALGGPLARGASLGVYCLSPEYGMALPGLSSRMMEVLSE